MVGLVLGSTRLSTNPGKNCLVPVGKDKLEMEQCLLTVEYALVFRDINSPCVMRGSRPTNLISLLENRPCFARSPPSLSSCQRLLYVTLDCSRHTQCYRDERRKGHTTHDCYGLCRFKGRYFIEVQGFRSLISTFATRLRVGNYVDGS